MDKRVRLPIRPPHSDAKRVNVAKYTAEELRALPDYVVRYLAPMQCMEEVRAEAIRRYMSQNRQNCDTSAERVPEAA
jgi:hypothetical protein